MDLFDQLIMLCEDRLLETNGKKIAEIKLIIDNEEFWIISGFLADVFKYINLFNKQLQGFNINVFEVSYATFIFFNFIFVKADAINLTLFPTFFCE